MVGGNYDVFTIKSTYPVPSFMVALFFCFAVCYKPSGRDFGELSFFESIHFNLKIPLTASPYKSVSTTVRASSIF